MEIEDSMTIALAGNPNVGKSTVFNELTGLRQHTGNWSGKTVVNAAGSFRYKDRSYTLMDIPGCYSLMAHSQEEVTARDFICFENPGLVIVVCDASCLERNLNLLLQIMEVSPKVLLCVNLMDEAKKKEIHIDLEKLEVLLDVPVVGTSARSKEGLEELLDRIEHVCTKEKGQICPLFVPTYLKPYVKRIEEQVRICYSKFPYKGWMALRLLEGDESLVKSIADYYPEKEGGANHERLSHCLNECRTMLFEAGITADHLKDDCAERYIVKAAEISGQVVSKGAAGYGKKERILDRIFTGRRSGFAIMFLLLLLVFWITIVGANYPSDLLSRGFGYLEMKLLSLLHFLHVPNLLVEMLISGVYKVLSWVIAVMLPPMMIFFPLFTLLEDFGYLPRVAYNLDKCFHKCGTCGKQALTMCMGVVNL